MMGSPLKFLTLQVVLVLVLIPILTEGCAFHYARLPPCYSNEYTEQDCVVKMGDTNQTMIQRQCVKIQITNVYERWEFWFGLILFFSLIAAGIITFRCVRYTKCYKELKDQIRHEKNRACARMCVKYCCPCKTCVKCCEPYTRPSASELKAQRDEHIDVSVPYHVRIKGEDHPHTHHHLHLDRRRSDCVHPAEMSSVHEPTYHEHHVENKDYDNKTLEEICVEGIHIG